MLTEEIQPGVTRPGEGFEAEPFVPCPAPKTFTLFPGADSHAVTDLRLPCKEVALLDNIVMEACQ